MPRTPTTPRPGSLDHLALTILDMIEHARRGPLAHAVLADALEGAIGDPTTDRVTGDPLAVWPVVRDVQTRLERLERSVFGGAVPPHGASAGAAPPGPDTTAAFYTFGRALAVSHLRQRQAVEAIAAGIAAGLAGEG